MTPSEFRAARKRLGMSREKLAAALGVDRKTIGNWSWGHTTPPAFLALAIEALERRAENRIAPPSK